MSNTYVGVLSRKQTPQTKAIPGREKEMVRNDAGGVSFGIDDWARLNRFLIIGTEAGSYYVNKQNLTQQNADAVVRCVAADGLRTVKTIVEISQAGRAPKNDPALFALAVCASVGDDTTKRAALAALPQVARIGTHLFHFASYIDGMRGWGRGLRNAVANWYTERSPESLAVQLAKYQSRDGWSHKDLLRLAHPKTESPAKQAALRWAVGASLDGRAVRHTEKSGEIVHEYAPVGEYLPELIQAFEKAKRAESKTEIVDLIVKYNLPRECVPTQFLNEPAVWEALLAKMGPEAMVRNLGKMTSIGLLAPMSDASRLVRAVLANEELLQKARLHPIKVLTALHVYRQGHGDKGSLSWQPVTQITDALDGAFYRCFKAVEPTGKRWMLALDVSGSMTWQSSQIPGLSGMTCRDASAALALVTANVEQDYLITAFTSGGYSREKNSRGWVSRGIGPVDISPKQRLDAVIDKISKIPMGGTDCSLPMLYAMDQKIKVDEFVIFTDNDTWAGNIHPSQALQQYRNAMGINAQLIVVGMVANGFSIADPKDPGMLDVVGYDTDTPAVMNQFALGA